LDNDILTIIILCTAIIPAQQIQKSLAHATFNAFSFSVLSSLLSLVLLTAYSE